LAKESPFDFCLHKNFDRDLNILSIQSPFDDYIFPNVVSPFKSYEFKNTSAFVDHGDQNSTPPTTNNTPSGSTPPPVNRTNLPRSHTTASPSHSPSVNNFNISTFSSSASNVTTPSVTSPVVASGPPPVNNITTTPTSTPPVSNSNNAVSPNTLNRGKSSVKKKFSLFSPKKKKLNETRNFNDVLHDRDLFDSFIKYLRKKGNPNNLRLYEDINKFREETGSLDQKAMNMCFDYLGGNGEVSVDLPNTDVAQLVQLVRSKQIDRNMFDNAKTQLDRILRQAFTDFNS